MHYNRAVLCVFRSLGLHSEIISAAECAKICPILRTDDIVGALYVDDDISAGDPGDICRSLSQQAQSQGVFKVSRSNIALPCPRLHYETVPCQQVPL